MEGRKRCPLVKPCPLPPMVMNGKCSCFPSPQKPAELRWSRLRCNSGPISIYPSHVVYHLHVFTSRDGRPRSSNATARQRKRPEATWSAWTSVPRSEAPKVQLCRRLHCARMPDTFRRRMNPDPCLGAGDSLDALTSATGSLSCSKGHADSSLDRFWPAQSNLEACQAVMIT